MDMLNDFINDQKLSKSLTRRNMSPGKGRLIRERSHLSDMGDDTRIKEAPPTARLRPKKPRAPTLSQASTKATEKREASTKATEMRETSASVKDKTGKVKTGVKDNIRAARKNVQDKMNSIKSMSMCDKIITFCTPFKKLEGWIRNSLRFLTQYIHKIDNQGGWVAMPFNFSSLIILIYIFFISMFAILKKFGWPVMEMKNMLSLNILFWLCSIYKFVLGLVLIIVSYLAVPRLFSAFNRTFSDNLTEILINVIYLLPWLYILLGFIIGNGLVMGLYKIACDNKKLNLAGFAHWPDNIMTAVLFVCLILLILIRIIDCDPGIITYKIFIVISISYFIYRAFILIIEYIVSQNLLFLLGEASNEDCKDEDYADEKDAAWNDIINSFIAIIIWPLIFGILVLQGLPMGSATNSWIIATINTTRKRLYDAMDFKLTKVTKKF